VKGLLDDAYELAVQLRDTLEEAAAFAAHAPTPRGLAANEDLRDSADDLANRIDRQRTALRGS
jgi:hypothetical protein